MTTALRLALARRDAPPAPLLAIQAYVREHGMPDAAARKRALEFLYRDRPELLERLKQGD